MNRRDLRLLVTHTVHDANFIVTVDMLEDFYYRILQYAGERASNEFLRMVVDLPDLVPEKLLPGLYALCENNWMYVPDFTGERESVDFEIALFVVNEIQQRLCVERGLLEIRESELIKREFLKRHLSADEFGRKFPPIFPRSN